MRIAVYNIAAREGGAFFVLRDFYQKVLKNNSDDIEWLFLTQIAFDEHKKNVTVKRFDCSTRIRRIISDLIYVPRTLNEFNPDVVISLQNTTVYGTKKPQFVYMHQSLQYCPYRFSLLKPEERNTAIRQKFICGSYKSGLKKSKHIFVQTKWIQEATAEWTGRSVDDITVVPVKMKTPKKESPNEGLDRRTFFYPARAEMYKNHAVLIEACKILQQRGISDFKVLLTVSDDNAYAVKLKKAAKNLPIDFVGQIPYEKIWDYYRISTLIFPSYLETCGLPLLEARSVGTWIIAADMPYAREALEGYENVDFFDYQSSQELSERMRAVLDRKVEISYTDNKVRQSISLVEAVLKEIENENIMANKHTVSV